MRLDAVHVQGEFHLGLKEVEPHQEALLGLDERGVLADALRQFAQDADNLFALVVLEHLQLVVDLVALCGFNEGHRPRL